MEIIIKKTTKVVWGILKYFIKSYWQNEELLEIPTFSKRVGIFMAIHRQNHKDFPGNYFRKLISRVLVSINLYIFRTNSI